MKLVVWDLDETIWHGTIYYGDSVTLKPEAREVLKQLDKLGIKQAICSHNNFASAVKKIAELGLTKYFFVIKAKVGVEKDVMVKQILKEQKFLPEETLFVDDTMFNREIVRESVGCHVDYEEDLYQIMKYFDTDRLILMNQQRNRLNDENNWVGTKEEFLKKIRSEIHIKTASKEEISRLTTLANRTNELNSTRNRYTEVEIEKFIKEKSYIVYVAYLKDKFGDYGLIGEVIIEVQNKNWFIKDICVSCRTLGRGIGGKLIEYVYDMAKKSDIKKLIAHIVPSIDNFRMKPLFENRGFKYIRNDDTTEIYEQVIK